MTLLSSVREIAVKDALFTRKLTEAETFYYQWHEIKTAIANIPSNGYSHKLPDFDSTVREAIDEFKHCITHPTLTIAVTGTTSSGKSSLINLLCGADIMPRTESEMSAGIVSLRHIFDGKIRLTIHKTRNAQWECGTWDQPSDEMIRQKLTECMDSYNNLRTESNPPDYPKIELDYPIACFLDKSLLGLQGLPETTQFKLLDLPGLRNTSDTLNKEVIQQCREALCLVTYNMAENDELKRQELIMQVVEQVKKMGGSPKRMLFVMNRIDAFNKDPDASRRQDEAVSKALAEIKTTLSAALPEYKQHINELKHCRLSSLPAMHSYRLQDKRLNIHAAQELDRHFQSLISIDVLEDLPRSPNKWEPHDFKRVQESVWQKSHATDFFNLLDSHIQLHFATLVLPPVIEDLKGKINAPVGELLRHAKTQLADSEQKCREALERLGKQNEQLTQLFEYSAKQLSAFQQTNDLEAACKTLLKQEPYQSLTEDSLAPLYDWDENIKRAMQGVIQGAIKNDFRGTTAELMPIHLQNKLKRVCSTFIDSKYPVNGAEISKSREIEIGNYYKSIFNFSSDISDIITNYVERNVFPQELQRIKEALYYLLSQYLDYLQTQINENVPDWGLSLISKNLLTTPDLFSGNQPIALDFSLGANFEEVIRDERNPWTLWITKRKVEYAQVPSVNTLVDVFSDQLDNERKRVYPLMAEEVNRLFSRVHGKIISEQDKVHLDFSEKYHQRLKEIEQGKQSAQAPWKALLPSLENWLSGYEKMTNNKILR